MPGLLVAEATCPLGLIDATFGVEGKKETPAQGQTGITNALQSPVDELIIAARSGIERVERLAQEFGRPFAPAPGIFVAFWLSVNSIDR